MLFKELYEFADSHERPPIRFEALRGQINAHHNAVGRVDVRRITYPNPTTSAHYILADTDRDSPYEEEYTVAEIAYCSALDADESEKRYALTKELMHVFDTDEQRAGSRERFIQLMRDVQNRPLEKHASAMYRSEMDTRWMAALILCPKSLRDPIADAFRANGISLPEVAELFRIPEWVASFVMDPYYDTAFASLVEGTNGGN
jgi:hypothetical protein